MKPLAEIGAGLAQAAPVSGRLAVGRSPGGATVVDDCYNANPASARAALATTTHVFIARLPIAVPDHVFVGSPDTVPTKPKLP